MRCGWALLHHDRKQNFLKKTEKETLEMFFCTSDNVVSLGFSCRNLKTNLTSSLCDVAYDAYVCMYVRVCVVVCMHRINHTFTISVCIRVCFNQMCVVNHLKVGLDLYIIVYIILWCGCVFTIYWLNHMSSQLKLKNLHEPLLHFSLIAYSMTSVRNHLHPIFFISLFYYMLEVEIH